VQTKLGKRQADGIEWSKPRLLCIAGDLTRYDEDTVQQIDRNIELSRYWRYGDELLLFEAVNTPILQTAAEPVADNRAAPKPKVIYKTISEVLTQANPEPRDRYEALKAFLLALGDDVQINTLKCYFAFKRVKNLACLEFRTMQDNILVYVKANPDSVTLEKGFTRDVRNIECYGTGDLEITISNHDDLDKSKGVVSQELQCKLTCAWHHL